MPAFARTPHSERLFYAVDNHPASGAHQLIADALVQALKTALPASFHCTQLATN
jgi:hypothetical protein